MVEIFLYFSVTLIDPRYSQHEICGIVCSPNFSSVLESICSFFLKLHSIYFVLLLRRKPCTKVFGHISNFSFISSLNFPTKTISSAKNIYCDTIYSICSISMYGTKIIDMGSKFVLLASFLEM
jgi:hypothetical protein